MRTEKDPLDLATWMFLTVLKSELQESEAHRRQDRMVYKINGKWRNRENGVVNFHEMKEESAEESRKIGQWLQEEGGRQGIAFWRWDRVQHACLLMGMVQQTGRQPWLRGEGAWGRAVLKKARGYTISEWRSQDLNPGNQSSYSFQCTMLPNAYFWGRAWGSAAYVSYWYKPIMSWFKCELLMTLEHFSSCKHSNS